MLISAFKSTNSLLSLTNKHLINIYYFFKYPVCVHNNTDT